MALSDIEQQVINSTVFGGLSPAQLQGAGPKAPTALQQSVGKALQKVQGGLYSGDSSAPIPLSEETKAALGSGGGPQVGPPAYQYQQTANQQTLKKSEIISRTKPDAAAAAAAIVTGQTPNIEGGKYVRNLIQTLYSQEVAIGNSISKVTSSITGGIQGAGNSFAGALNGASETITKALKPVSTALGGTLGTLTGIAKDPLGSMTLLPRTLGDVVEKVNPGFAARMEATYKKYKMENFAHLPQQVMGSIKNLLTGLDAIIALPLAILQDLYQGLMDIMKAVSDLVDQIITVVMQFFMDIINAIIPLDAILSFIEAVSSLASEIGGIAGTFLGSNPISQFSLSVQSYANVLGGAIANPMNLVSAYMPPQVSQGLYTLRNPQQLVNNILPAGLSQQFAKISSITGFGFNGNMGFGFESVLQGLQGGVISSILSNFASQYSVLTPLVNAGSGNANSNAPSNPPMLKQSSIGSGQSVAQGVVQPQSMPNRPIPGQAMAGGPNNNGQPEVRRAFPVGTTPKAVPVNPNGSPANRPAVANKKGSSATTTSKTGTLNT